MDVELGNTSRAIIVTGPNTGGKTVSLKTIGLLESDGNDLACSFQPKMEVSSACLMPYMLILGDKQSIEQKFKYVFQPFNKHYPHIQQYDAKKLILLDELGAGTDPAEGSALAIAMLEHMHKQGCRIVATTHYSELKAYAYNRKGVINLQYHQRQTLSPTYRLLVGVPGRSNAFAIAERLGLQKSIIDHARGGEGG